MKLDIKICTNSNCTVTINDRTTVGDQGYLAPDSNSSVKNRFRYKDTVAIDVLQLNKTTGSVTQSVTLSTRDSNIVPVTIPVNFDGWFTIYHIVLPSKQWLETEQSKSNGSLLGIYDTLYFSDGDQVYKLISNGEYQEVEISEIVNRNTEGTTISIVEKDYVSVCFLKKCYIYLCQQIFNSEAFTQCFNKTDIGEVHFKRDLVWMALNVIKYLTEFNQLAEAQRVLEQLEGCHGVCKQELGNKPRLGCGCS